MFYSHVICSGTKIKTTLKGEKLEFYSHVICSGTKIEKTVFIPIYRFIVT